MTDPIRPISIRTAEGWQQLAYQGPAGPQGVQGPTGPAGPEGPPLAYPLVNRFTTNSWYGQPIVAVGASLPTEGVIGINLLAIPAGFAITSMIFEITIAGSTGALTRTGVYRLNASSAGGVLEVDNGAVPATAIGQIEVPCAVDAKAAPWMALLSLVTQGGATTRPTYRHGGSMPQVPPIGKLATAGVVNNAAYGAYILSGVGGALPATFSNVNDATYSPRVLIRGTQS